MAPRNPPINIENAKIIWRNFSGRKTKYTPAGIRTFHLVISPEDGKRMQEDGWNIKWGKPRPDGSALDPHTEIKVQYDSLFPPKIYMKSGDDGKAKLLTEDTVAILDAAEIIHIDMVINPSRWNVNGATGIKGYLKSMYVTIAPPDPFEAAYLAEDDTPAPFDADD